MSVRIIIDSASDISLKEAIEWKLDFLPLKVTFEEEEYLDGIDLSKEEFYEKLVESDKLPKTSQIAPYDFEEKFEQVKQDGDTAVCITLSSKLSGTYQSAVLAQSQYSDYISLVDSENVCIGERILIKMAIRMREQGLDAKQIANKLDEEKKKIRVIALFDTLEYLKRGGRISGAVAAAGSLLSIKPVIAIENGEVAILGKARGSKNGSNMLVELTKQHGIDFDKPCALAYSGLSDTLLQKYRGDSEFIYKEHLAEIPISTIGATIGTHAGPGAIAAAFFEKV